jgi:hypothetical protein
MPTTGKKITCIYARSDVKPHKHGGIFAATTGFDKPVIEVREGREQWTMDIFPQMDDGVY